MTRLRRPDVLAGIGAGLIALADDAVYLVLIAGQNGPYDRRTFFVASFLVLMAAAAITGAIVGAARVRASLLALTAAGCVGLGIIGILSIGAPLLIAAMFATYAAARVTPRAPALYYVAGAVAGLTVLVGGFVLTSLGTR
jgi:hypothetical protein